MPSLSFADHNSVNSNVFVPSILDGPLVVCTGTGGGGFKACSNLCDLIAQIANVIYFMIAVVLWIIAPILLAVGGIMIMLAGTSPEMISRGKKTITGAIWGIVIVLCAWLLVFSVVHAFGNLGKYIGGFTGSGSSDLLSCTP